MLGYCDAIEECGRLPAFSIWPLVRLAFKAWLFAFALYVAMILLIPDFILLLLRTTIGWPRLVLGRRVYRYLARPFRSIWAGEIPWFRIFRVRYITRLLLCYRSRRKIDALQDALNRSEFQMLASGSCAIALAETETLQKAVGLVKQITESRLKIEAIVALGPILTIFSLATQKLILPIVHDVTDYLLDKVGLSAFAVSALQNKQMVQNVLVFFVLVFLYAIWLIASAWMDGRSILTKLGVHQLERSVFARVGIISRPELPFDIVAFVIVSIGLMSLPVWLSVYASLAPLAPGNVPQETMMTVLQMEARADAVSFGVFAIGLGLIALLRRVTFVEVRGYSRRPRLCLRRLQAYVTRLCKNVEF